MQCRDCGHFVWHSPSTALEDIPADVQIRFALKKSVSEGTGASLLCSRTNCLTNSNQPRRANKECERSPPQCSSCCKASGGCRVHRLSDRDIPSTLLTKSVSPAGTPPPPASTPAPTLSAPLPAATRSYARPLDENYARAYLDAHRKTQDTQAQIAVQQQLASSVANTVHIVLWNEVQTIFVSLVLGAESLQAQKPPIHLQVVNKHAGTCVPAENKILRNTMHGSEIIAVLTDSTRSEWALQEIDVPIPVESNGRILLRSYELADADCIGLKEEISLLVTFNRPFPCASHVQCVDANSSSHPSNLALTIPQSEVELVDAANQPTASESAESGQRAQVSLRFPMSYVCDMAEGMQALSEVRGVEGLGKRFKEVFPHCSKFKSATVYRHLRVYKSAVVTGLLADFVSMGRTPNGKWSELQRMLEGDS